MDTSQHTTAMVELLKISGSTNTKPLGKPLGAAGAAVIERYGDAESFQRTFAPAKQIAYSAPHLRARIYVGDAPKLRELVEAYGEGEALAWIMDQIVEFSEYSNARDKLTSEQYVQGAGLILHNYQGVKVTELMLFFAELKGGKYGSFYGAVDMVRILEALRAYNHERMKLRAQYEEQRIKQIRERQQAEHDQLCITWEEYQQLNRQNSK